MAGAAGPDGLRWMPIPTRWHLTLAFLGDVDAGCGPGDSRRAVASVAGDHAAVQLADRAGSGLSVGRGEARVLWYGVGDPDGALAVARGDSPTRWGSTWSDAVPAARHPRPGARPAGRPARLDRGGVGVAAPASCLDRGRDSR